MVSAADLFLLLARLIAAIGRILALTRSEQRTEAMRWIGSLLFSICHGVEALEKALVDRK